MRPLQHIVGQPGMTHSVLSLPGPEGNRQPREIDAGKYGAPRLAFPDGQGRGERTRRHNLAGRDRREFRQALKRAG